MLGLLSEKSRLHPQSGSKARGKDRCGSVEVVGESMLKARRRDGGAVSGSTKKAVGGDEAHAVSAGGRGQGVHVRAGWEVDPGEVAA